MNKLTPEMAADVVSACQQSAAEIADALSRAFEQPFEVAVGEAAVWNPAAAPESFAQPALVLGLVVQGEAVLLAAPISPALPAWSSSADTRQTQRLAFLAQELGVLALPADTAVESFHVAAVASLSDAIVQAGGAAGAAIVPWKLTCEGAEGPAFLIWPCMQPRALFSERAAPGSVRPAAPKPAQTAGHSEQALTEYARSLLHIEAPVSVTLAARKQTVKQILELGPGSMIQFDKPCDQLLELEVAGHRIAFGEAVKVGDKFGLRITAMALPGERFEKVRRAPGK